MVSSLILLPFYTNAFTPAQFGVLSLLIGLSLFYYHIVNLSLDSYLSVHYHHEDHNHERLHVLLSSIFVVQLILGAVFFLLMLLIGQWITDLFMGESQVEYFWSGLTCVVTAITTSILKVHQNLQIQKKEPVRFFITSLVYSTLTVVLCIWLLGLFPGSINGPLFGRMIAGLVMLLFIVYSRYPWRVDFKIMRGWYAFCWPLALMGIIAWSFTYLSPYILNRFVDDHEIGLYSLVLSLMIAVDFFQNGLASAIYPQLFGMRKEAGNEITPEEKPYHHLYSMLSILAVGLALIGLPILVILLVKKQEYHEALTWLPLFAIAYLWRGAYSAGYSIALYQKETKMLMWNSLWSMALQVALTLVLAASYGLTGALIGTIAGRITQSLLLFYKTNSGQKTGVNPVKIFLVPGLMSAALMLVYFSPIRISHVQSGLICFGFSLVVSSVVYRKEMPKVLLLIRSSLSRRKS